MKESSGRVPMVDDVVVSTKAVAALLLGFRLLYGGLRVSMRMRQRGGFEKHGNRIGGNYSIPPPCQRFP